MAFTRVLYPARFGNCRFGATRMGYVPAHDSPANAHGGSDVSPKRREEVERLEVAPVTYTISNPWEDEVG